MKPCRSQAALYLVTNWIADILNSLLCGVSSMGICGDIGKTVGSYSKLDLGFCQCSQFIPMTDMR